MTNPLFQNRFFRFKIKVQDRPCSSNQLGTIGKTFTKISHCTGILITIAITVFQLRQYPGILVSFFRLPMNPFRQLMFQPTFFPDNIQLFNRLIHTNAILPIVGTLSILRSIFYTNSITFLHCIFPNSLFDSTNIYSCHIIGIHTFFHTIRRQITAGSPGITHRHTKRTFLITCQGNRSIIIRMIRNIIFRISCRFVMSIRIDTKNGKVSGMPRPNPVIGISPKLANRRGRSID